MVVLPHNTEEYDAWRGKLAHEAKHKLRKRMSRYFGVDGSDDLLRTNSTSVGDGVREIKFLGKGPGLRVYYEFYTDTDSKPRVRLLLGGDKGSQSRDIERAKRIAHQHRNADSLHPRTSRGSGEGRGG